MFKLVCLFALITVVASLPQYGQPGSQAVQAPVRQIVKRESLIPKATKDVTTAPGQENAAEAQDDLDKAETLGFGYVHVGVPYYPPFYHYPYPYYYPYPGYVYGYY